jgi:hypothetical protein
MTHASTLPEGEQSSVRQGTTFSYLALHLFGQHFDHGLRGSERFVKSMTSFPYIVSSP